MNDKKKKDTWTVIIAVLFIAVAGVLIANINERVSNNGGDGVIQDIDEEIYVDGSVRLIEYSDFKCPFCQTGAKTVEFLKKKYGDEISVEFRQFPLGFHKGSEIAAQASECARDQKRFWDYHDSLFDASSKSIDVGGRDVLKSIANKLELDMNEFNRCLDSGVKKEKVDADIASAKRYGIRGTPSFILGGELIFGAQPPKTFMEKIDSLLENKER